MNDIDPYSQLLKESGVLLTELGLREVALRRADALRAAEWLKASSVAILGGDVYLMQEETVSQAFADWYTDRRSGEEWREYVERSCSNTHRYIEQFPSRLDVTPLFVLVTSPLET